MVVVLDTVEERVVSTEIGAWTVEVVDPANDAGVEAADTVVSVDRTELWPHPVAMIADANINRIKRIATTAHKLCRTR